MNGQVMLHRQEKEEEGKEVASGDLVLFLLLLLHFIFVFTVFFIRPVHRPRPSVEPFRWPGYGNRVPFGRRIACRLPCGRSGAVGTLMPCKPKQMQLSPSMMLTEGCF